jgi:glycosyltransferase involved in cell wall biosynthesis
MGEGRVSVIVPVYNAESYLRRCLDSILNQSYSDLELVLVNDGSTDGSADICNEYEKKDNRVKFLSQTNQGPALARKYGVENAEGVYVMFVDSDDYIDEGYIYGLISYMNHSDLVTSGYIDETTGNKYYDLLEKGVYNTKERLDYLVDNMICYGNGYLRGGNGISG